MNTQDKFVVPVAFESTPGWTFSPGSALWRIGETHDGFGMSPPSISCGNISITASPSGLQFGDITCIVELPEGDAVDPVCQTDLDLVRRWFGDTVADCIEGHSGADNGFKMLCEVETGNMDILPKLARLAVIEQILEFEQIPGWGRADELRPEIIEAISLAVEVGWTQLIEAQS